MMKFLLNTLPNTGSTWLGGIVGRELQRHGYGDFHLEFFNPVQNEPLERELAVGFGCETIPCYRNIATGDDASLRRSIDALWPSTLCFTKEVFSPFKLRAFARAGFRCAVLTRPMDGQHGTFPPKRGRIWAFYEALYFALEEEELLDPRKRPGTMRERAIAAWTFTARWVEHEAVVLSVPIIRYQRLFGDETAVRAELAAWRLPPEVERGVVAAIVSTRVAKHIEAPA